MRRQQVCGLGSEGDEVPRVRGLGVWIWNPLQLLSRGGIQQAYGICPTRSHETVGARTRKSPNRLIRAAADRVQAFVLAEFPEIAPLESAQFGLARFGDVRAEQGLGALEISFLPRLQHHIHVRRVSLGFGFAPLLIDAISRNGRADADDEDENKEEDEG